MKCKITIEETISQEFEIEADSYEEAQEKGIELYKVGELVLDNPCVTDRNILAGEESSWINF